MQLKTYKINVSGKVQGVYYRNSTMQKAKELNLNGTVENLESAVEIIASGEETALKKLAEWCKIGPDKAEVTGVEVKEISYREFINFKIVE